MPAALVIASNRGPVSFSETSDGFEASRGIGGLVTAVTSAVRDEEAIWIATALSDGDRARARHPEPILGEPADGIEVRLLELDDSTLTAFYEEASNRAIWFAAHGVGASPVAASAWDAYRRANQTFAAAIDAAAAPDATVLVQDYHLCLVPALLRERRPDLAISFFWHIPVAGAEAWRTLGDAIATELIAGIDGADVAGFHARRWVNGFLDCRRVLTGRTHADVVAIPLGVDAESLAETAASAEVEDRLAALSSFDAMRLIVRADRIDPAKGVPDGLAAFDLLLERRPDLHESVVHLIRLTPSRGGIAEYDAELLRIQELAARINARFGSSSWQPVELLVEDDFPASLAAYRRFDVLLVSSLADGMNLVAREGPLVNERDGVLVLSQGAGAADAYTDGGALLVETGDVEGFAAALDTALEMDAAQRARIAGAARARAAGTDPAAWLTEQRRRARR